MKDNAVEFGELLCLTFEGYSDCSYQDVENPIGAWQNVDAEMAISDISVALILAGRFSSNLTLQKAGLYATYANLLNAVLYSGWATAANESYEYCTVDVIDTDFFCDTQDDPDLFLFHDDNQEAYTEYAYSAATASAVVGAIGIMKLRPIVANNVAYAEWEAEYGSEEADE